MIRSDDLVKGPYPDQLEAWGFTKPADVLVRSMVDLPARTRGEFTEIAIDLVAPAFPEHPNCIYEVDLLLRNKVIETAVFRNYTQRHHFMVSAQLLFEEINVLTLSPRATSGDMDSPCFFIRIFYVQRDRMVSIMERSSVWVFSTARSGSTWLSLDLLCHDHRNRPIDEPGIGKMFAPFEWEAERFYDIYRRAAYIESGMEFDGHRGARSDQLLLPVFERSFTYTGQENRIWSKQNWPMYMAFLKEAVFRLVMNEWGMIDYNQVVFKMPNDSHAADVIMQAFPESFMVFLIRDGRDVMKSRFSPFASADLAETIDPSMRLHAIAFYSHFWNFQVDIMSAAFLAHSPERSLIVSYEDLRRDTAGQLRVIFDRIGRVITDAELADLVERTTLENLPDDQKGPDKQRQTGEIGGFRSVFSYYEIELMEAIMGHNLQRFNYL